MFRKLRWDSSKATLSENIIKAERNEHPHYCNVNKKVLENIIKKKKAKTQKKSNTNSYSFFSNKSK